MNLSPGIHSLESGICHISDLTGLSCLLYAEPRTQLAASQKTDALLSAFRKHPEGRGRYRRFISAHIPRALSQKVPFVAQGPTGQRHMFIPVICGETPLAVVAEGFYASADEFARFFEVHHREQWMSGNGPDAWLRKIMIMPPHRTDDVMRAAGRVLADISEKERLAARLREQRQEHEHRVASIGLTGLKISDMYFIHGDWQGLCNAIVREAASMVGAEKCSLMLPDHTDSLTVRAVTGRSAPVFADVRVRAGQGIAGLVYQRGEPLLIGTKEEFSKYGTAVKPAFKTSSCLSMPLRIADKIVGILNLSDKSTGGAFSRDDLSVLAPFSLQASMLLQLGRYHRLTEHLGELSITDPLTGVYNRRYFDIRLKEEYQRALRHGHDLSLALVDMDNFKQINDSHGHAEGDRILRDATATMTHTIRAHDVLARLGGDEFAIIMPRTSRQEAGHAALRLKDAIKECISLSPDNVQGKAITVCIGIATYPDCGGPLETMVCRADRALYRAKAEGKDCVAGL